MGGRKRCAALWLSKIGAITRERPNAAVFLGKVYQRPAEIARFRQNSHLMVQPEKEAGAAIIDQLSIEICQLLQKPARSLETKNGEYSEMIIEKCQ